VLYWKSLGLESKGFLVTLIFKSLVNVFLIKQTGALHQYQELLDICYSKVKISWGNKNV